MNNFLKVSRMKKMVAELRDFENKIQDLKLTVCSASWRNSGLLLWLGISTDFFFISAAPTYNEFVTFADCFRLKKSGKRLLKIRESLYLIGSSSRCLTLVVCGPTKK